MEKLNLSFKEINSKLVAFITFRESVFSLKDSFSVSRYLEDELKIAKNIC
jgi:hypothetical protein